jgi:transposase
MEDGRKLARVTRAAKDPVRMRRTIVVLMSGQGQAVRDITSLLQVSADYVRDVIHAFNERGSMRWIHNGTGDARGRSVSRSANGSV